MRGGRGNPGRRPCKRELDSKIHMAVDSHGMPVRFIVAAGTVAGRRVASQLIEGASAGSLLADRGCDSDAVIAAARGGGMEPVIPPKRNRASKRDFDRRLYKQRHLVENAFMHLNRWRGVATRYAKNLSSFVASVQICCLMRWLHIS